MICAAWLCLATQKPEADGNQECIFTAALALRSRGLVIGSREKEREEKEEKEEKKKKKKKNKKEEERRRRRRRRKKEKTLK